MCDRSPVSRRILQILVAAIVFISLNAHAATISGVSSSTANGRYRAGDQISIQVSFSAPVTVTGTPHLTLETGTSDAVVSYASGSGTSILTFLYTVSSGHSSSDLDYQSQNALVLNGGTILNTATNSNASLTLPTPGSSGSLGTNNDLIIDTTAPTVSVSLLSSSVTNTLPISAQITFSESVSGFSSSDLSVTNGTVTGLSGSGSSYTATITATSQGAVTIQIPANSAFDGANNGNAASSSVTAQYDTQSPFVTNVTSSPSTGTYRGTQSVNVILTFSESVVVSGGTPSVSLASNSPAPSALYVSGSGTSQLTFRYTINSGDTSEDLDYSSTTALVLNGSSIRDNAGNTGILTLPNPGGANSLSSNSNVIIDTSLPSVAITSTVSGDTALDAIPVTVVFSEVVTGFTLSDLSVTNGCASNLQGSGTTYTAYIVPRANGPVTVTVPAGAAIDRAGNGNTAAPIPASMNFFTYAPLVTSVTSLTPNSAYRAGQQISIQVSFSEAVVVDGTPQLRLATGSIATVDYLSGSGTDTLTFLYTIASGQNSVDLDYTSLPALNFNGGNILDAATQSLDIARTFACPGSAGSLSFNRNIIVDTTAPTISRVSSSTTNGAYRAGQTLNVLTQFSETIYVTGTPLLTLETGPNDAVVSMTSGSGTSNLNFSYTIVAGHNSNRLDYQSVNAFELNGSVIQDLAGNIAVVTLPATGSANSLFGQRQLVVDTIPPTVSNITSTTSNGSYKAGSSINVRVALSEVVTVIGSPRIQLATGLPNRFATLSGGSGTSNLNFTYTVTSGDTADDLDYISTSALLLNDSTIRDQAGNDTITSLATPGNQFSLSANKDIRLDTTPPTITGVSSSLTDGSYPTGTIVPISISFSEPVNVSGTPYLHLNTTPNQGIASYSSGSGGTVLTFDYVVQSGENSSILDYASSLALIIPVGGSIHDTALNDSVLTLPSPGMAGSLSAASFITIDTVAPTVTEVTSDTPDGSYRVGDSLSLLVTFSEPVLLTEALQLTLASGPTLRQASCTSLISDTSLACTYTVQAGDTTPDLDYHSSTSLALADHTASLVDTAGNNASLTLFSPGAPGSLGAAKNLVLDTTEPSAILSSSAPTDTNTSPIPVTITFSEPVTGLTPTTFSLTNAAIQNLSGSGVLYTAQLIPSAQGAVSVTLGPGAALDAAGNSNFTSNTLSRNYDTIHPTVAITSPLPERSSASSIPITITFSESVSGFDSTDISVTNGTITGFSGAAGDYAAMIEPTADGEVTISIAQNVAVDVAQNGNQASTTLSRTIDRSIPTVISVTTTLADGAYDAGTVIALDIVFSEPVQLHGDFTLQLATGNVASKASCSHITIPNTLRCSYTVVAGDTSADLDYVSDNALIRVAAATLSDLAQNPASLTLPTPGASGSLSFNHAIILDTTAPFAILSSSALTDTNTSPIPVTITFSEPVTGLTVAAFSLTNATIQNLLGSGVRYTAQLMPSAQGAISATLDAGATLDAAGNANLASNTLVRTYDSIQPTVAITTSLPERSNGPSIPLIITFSEPVFGFDSTDISVMNGSVTSLTGVGSDYAATIAPSADGPVSISIAHNAAVDVAQNSNLAATPLTRTIDRSAPTVTSVTTSLDDGAYGAGTVITLQVVFDEPVQLNGSFNLELATTNGPSLALCSQIITPTSLQCTYTVATGDTSTDLDYVSENALVGVSGATLSDLAQNPASLILPSPGLSGSLSFSHALILHATAPSAILSSAAPTDTNTSPIPFTVIFSEPVTGLTLAAFSLTNATIQNLSGSGALYTAQLVPSTQGTVSVALGAGAALDAAGNSSLASNTLSRSYDSIRPTVAITTSIPERASTSSIPITITFSESVSGFDSTDISITNGAIASFSGFGAAYTAIVEPSVDGEVAISIAQNIAIDAAQNGNHASTTLTRTIDRTKPTATSVTTNLPDGAYGVGTAITIDIVFSEPVQLRGSFTLELATTNGPSLALCSQITTPNTLRCSYTISNGDTSADLDYVSEDALVAVAAATILDLAQNPASLILATPGTAGSLSLNHALAVDTSRPSATLTSSAPTVTHSSPLQIAVNFSEVVHGVSASTFAVSNGSIQSITGSDSSFILSVIPRSQGNVSISVLQDGAFDNAQNGCTASTELIRQFDSLRPTVTIEQTSSQIISSNEVTIPIEFSESVSGFEAVDVKVTNGIVQSLSGSGSSYSARIITGQDGQLTVSVPADTAFDSAGNGNVASDTFNRTVDTTAPYVVSVTATNPDGYYKAGDILTLQVQLSEVVTLSGAPSLQLQTGRLEAHASYKSGSGSTKLLFEYVVSAGDNSPDLDYASVEALSLNGGSIRDLAELPLYTTLPALGSALSLAAHKDIAIDTLAPTIPLILAPTPGQILSGDKVVINGTTEAQAALEVLDSKDRLLCSTTSNESGAWSCEVADLTDGSYTVRARAEDIAGNSSFSESVEFTVNTTLPSPPVFTEPANGITTESNPRFAGTATPLMVVWVRREEGDLCTATVDSHGAWACSSTISLKPGRYSIQGITEAPADSARSLPASLSLTVGAQFSGVVVMANRSQEPLAGVTITDGTISTKTTADGSYSLVTPDPLSPSVTAFKKGWRISRASTAEIGAASAADGVRWYATPALESEAYTIWDGSLLPFKPSLRILNRATSGHPIRVTLYRSDGTECVEKLSTTVNSFDYVALPLDDTPCFRSDSFGLVKINYPSNEYDGDLTMQRGARMDAWLTSAFSLPLANSITGSSYALVDNAYHIERGGMQAYSMRNDLLISNLSESEKRFTIRRYRSDSTVAKSDTVVIPGYGSTKIEFPIDGEERQENGFQEVLPEDPLSPYTAVLLRRGEQQLRPPHKTGNFLSMDYTRAGETRNLFARVQYLPKRFAVQYLEVANVSSVGANVRIARINKRGRIRPTISIYLKPKETRKIRISRLLELYQEGVAQISSDIPDSIIVNSIMKHYRGDQRLLSIKSLAIRETFGDTLYGMYQRIGRARTKLKLTNIDTREVQGSITCYQDSQPLDVQPFSLMPGGQNELMLSKCLGDGTRGVIEVNGSRPGSIIADTLVFKRRQDVHLPGRLR